MAIAVNASRLIASTGAPGFNGFAEIPFAVAPAAGSAVLVSVGGSNSIDVIIDMRDTQGNTYVRLFTTTQGSSLRSYVYLCASQRGLTTNDRLQIACLSGTIVAVAADEITGLGSVTLPDKTASAGSSSSSATYAAGPSAATTYANELVWEVITSPQYATAQSITPSDGATIQGGKVTATNVAMYTAYRIVAATGTQSAGGSFNTNNATAYLVIMVTLPDPQSPASTRRAASFAGAETSAILGTSRGASFVGAEVSKLVTGSRGASFVGVEVAGVVTAAPPVTTTTRPPIIVA